MKIAIVTEVFPPKIDGITNRLRHTIREFASMGHEVLVVAPDTGRPIEGVSRIIGVGSVPFPPYPEIRITWPSPRILTGLASFAPDVVHVVGPACIGMWGAFYAKLSGFPLVASYHTDYPRYMPLYGLRWMVPAVWPLLRMVHNRAVVNLCPSTVVKRELEAHGIRRVGLWRGGVDLDRYNPARRSEAMRARLSGGAPDAPLALYVGRVSHEKALDRLDEVLGRVPGLRLAIVGDGPARRHFEKRWAGRPVTFTGFLAGEELAAAYASADVFVMPSCTETLGFATLEAMASGLPVVASRAGGTIDLVEDGLNGRLCDANEPAQLGEAVADLFAQPSRRWAWAWAAREAAEHSSWPAQTRLLVRWYDEARIVHEALRRQIRLAPRAYVAEALSREVLGRPGAPLGEAPLGK